MMMITMVSIAAFFCGYSMEKNKVFLKISMLPKYYMTVMVMQKYAENISRFSTSLNHLSLYHTIPLFSETNTFSQLQKNALIIVVHVITVAFFTHKENNLFHFPPFFTNDALKEIFINISCLAPVEFLCLLSQIKIMI